MNKKVIFFDTETNGVTADSSVLSIAALKCVFNGIHIDTIADHFTRYYFRKPGEAQNKDAIAVNGLTDEVILQKRGNASYAPFFYQDMPDFYQFCCEVRHYVGHNIAFDKKFIPFSLEYTFCTMRENTNILRLTRRNGARKWPRLSETAAYYHLDLHQAQFHDSEYDTFITYEIFKKMLDASETRDRILQFLAQA
jgi:DNA polymerase-3 subunit epsilon